MTHVPADDELVARCKLGDSEAFGQLVKRYERSVLAVALAELREIHAAEDVAQSALLLAFRKLASLRDGARFGPWLLQITRRQVVEWARRHPVSNLAEASAATDCAIERPADPCGEHEKLLALVTRLPDHERVLVGLRYFDGYSMSEIAQITGRPLGTVTKQISRAVRRLRDWYPEARP